MTVFITSSPCIDGAPRAILNPANGFLDRIREVLPEHPNCLFVASSPEDRDATCEFGSHMFIAFAEAGITFASYAILDDINAEDAAEMIAMSDFIILAGGHVPTQNDFFHEIGLDVLLQDYEGVIMGISAGSMNAAEVVYVQPEEEGESVPEFERFRPGLGLTRAQVCPHYQKVKHSMLDGLRLFEDITYADSMGHTFFALRDGSYILCENGEETLFGEAYRIRNSILELICVEDEWVSLEKLL